MDESGSLLRVARNRLRSPLRGVPLLLAILALAAVGLGAVAFLLQRPPAGPTPVAVSVARVADISATPITRQVTFARGSDRIEQRKGGPAECRGAGSNMGCTAIVTAPVTVFLVRDPANTVHAFIGEDPRNGCALEWLPEKPENQQPAVFHDTCHGSIYDRTGKVVGGPSPWNLNELASEVRGEELWLDPSRVKVGASALR